MTSPVADDHHHFPGLSRIGALLADPGRAAMLWSLMDGSARPAGELTMIAGLSPSAGSAYLVRLTASGRAASSAPRAGRHALRPHLLRPYGGRIVGAGVRAAGRTRSADAARL